MTDLILQPMPLAESTYTFIDEGERLSTAYKWQVLSDWQRFIYNGFKKLFFTGDLYRFLTAECGFIARYNLEYFWVYYFNSEVIHLRAFLNQFGGTRVSVDFNTPAWSGGPATDLKQAMCQETVTLYTPLTQVLDDLEFKHAEIGRVWREFALASGIPDPGFPPHYRISENSRNLLAYAASIAISQARPLQALQFRFPTPLLQAGL